MAHNNCKETTRPLIDALHPDKEVPSLQTFEDLAYPDIVMSEIEISRSQMTSNSEDVRDIYYGKLTFSLVIYM